MTSLRLVLSRSVAAVLPAAVALFVLDGGALTARAAAPAKSKGESLFNGKTLQGWSGLPGHWTVKDGAITGYTTPSNPMTQNTFLVWTNGVVSDFELRLKYKILGGNSGVQYRSQLMDPATYVVGGYQADIDSTPRYSGILYEERKRGILSERGQRTLVKDVDGKTVVKVVGTIGTPEALQRFIHTDDWNDYTIIARGNQVLHFINGHLMSDCVDLSASAPKEGILALQIHTGPPMQVQFKDLTLFRLPPAEPESGLPITEAPKPAKTSGVSTNANSKSK